MTKPPPLTLRIIRSEHAALGAVLHSLQLMSRQASTQQPHFESLRALLFYLDEFPEQRHHRKESELLFPKLRARTPLAREALDELDAQHARGERMIRELQHALLAFEMLGESRRGHFERVLQWYLEFYQRHIATEEREILPLAERMLSAQDWDELDEQFARNRDGLAGTAPDDEYEALFSRITHLVPAPLGLGPAR